MDNEKTSQQDDDDVVAHVLALADRLERGENSQTLTNELQQCLERTCREDSESTLNFEMLAMMYDSAAQPERAAAIRELSAFVSDWDERFLIKRIERLCGALNLSDGATVILANRFRSEQGERVYRHQWCDPLSPLPWRKPRP